MNIPNILKLIFLTMIFFITALINANCSTVSRESNDRNNRESAYNAAYQEAENTRMQAASLANEWRDTKKLLDSSKKSASAGDYDKAISLANKAKLEYQMAIAQVQHNEENLKVTPFYDPDAAPEDDVKNIQAFFRNKFPGLPDTEFANGFYAMDPVMRVNWEAIEEFPPYVPAIEEGEGIWNTPFKNQKDYNDCFNEPGIMTDYPRWDREAGEVETLPMAINKCREINGEQALKYESPEMLALQAYIAYQSRGNLTEVLVPHDDPRAL
ncbi:MAG: hypothetical protein L0Z73_19405, partial [Gammaproteobacteria bacterium]|nr:hypothetical protein [Gammaproteobacteria bacterium]